MGEVYRARDTRLDRTVALKVLPAALAADPEFRERFAREAKSISALSHPNICTLFDVGEAPAASCQPPAASPETVHYLVMEYLEGETLGTRLERGALPLADALTIAIEIASALDKAHRQGIVHRDLKPGNIMLVKSGGARSGVTQAKLLDFGLAKTGPAAAVSAAAPTALAASPGPTAPPLTAHGTILGTIQYMAPEQVEGEEADARTDLFAFGAVLFEMLTGRRAFAGKSQAGLLGAILKEQPPPVSRIAPVAPPALDHVVGACLAKDPDARFQSAHDLLLQLRWIAEGGSAAGVAAPVVAHRRNRERFAWVTAAFGVVLVIAATLIVPHLREAAPVVNPIEFPISVPENSFFAGTAPQFAVSPDGRQVVFVASLDAVQVLWVRSLSTALARPLPGTERATYPFWSHDSRFIAFFAAGKLKKVALSGGPPAEICPAPADRGGTWNRDNVILFSPTYDSPILRVASAGAGTAAPVTALGTGEMSHRWPSFLPDGRHFLFFVGTGDGATGEIRAGSLDSKDTVAVVASDSNGLYAQGHVVFVRGGTLMAQPFNPDTRQPTADAFPVAEQVTVDNAAYGAYSLSTTGVLTYARGAGRRQVTWFDRTGTSIGVVGEPGDNANMSLSPDERRAAVSLQKGKPANRDIYMIDLTRDGGVSSRFSFDPASENVPIWSPDGTQIAFSSNRDGGTHHIYVKAVSGTGQEELWLKSATTKYVTDWSRVGQFLAFTSQAPATATGMDLWVLPLSGEKKPSLFLQTPFNEDNAVFSPDVHWIAYDSNENGTATQIYVRPFPAAPGQAPYQISSNGGVQPMWRDDGTELFFLAPDGALMAASISTEKGFEFGSPKALFPTGVVFTGNRRLYAVAKGGKRFLLVVPEQRFSSSPINVVVNWLERLREGTR
jgi:Tol biopolymer transport system component